jgi:hypothetical protein
MGQHRAVSDTVWIRFRPCPRIAKKSQKTAINFIRFRMVRGLITSTQRYCYTGVTAAGTSASAARSSQSHPLRLLAAPIRVESEWRCAVHTNMEPLEGSPRKVGTAATRLPPSIAATTARLHGASHQAISARGAEQHLGSPSMTGTPFECFNGQFRRMMLARIARRLGFVALCAFCDLPGSGTRILRI